MGPRATSGHPAWLASRLTFIAADRLQIGIPVSCASSVSNRLAAPSSSGGPSILRSEANAPAWARSCRVRGIAALRVADASVMPSVVATYTNATALAIAERAASILIDG